MPLIFFRSRTCSIFFSSAHLIVFVFPCRRITFIQENNAIAESDYTESLTMKTNKKEGRRWVPGICWSSSFPQSRYRAKRRTNGYRHETFKTHTQPSHPSLSPIVPLPSRIRAWTARCFSGYGLHYSWPSLKPKTLLPPRLSLFWLRRSRNWRRESMQHGYSSLAW